MFGLNREVAVLSEYDGEARLVQSTGELDAARCAAVFVCEVGHDGTALSAAAASGTLVVDLTGSIADAALAGSKGAVNDSRVFAVPHPLTILLDGLLAPLHRAVGVERASAFVLRPASDFGEPGLEELREQTVRLLRFEPTPTEVFGRQLAFNVLPEHLFPSGEESSAARVVYECRALLGAPELPLAVSFALVPLFYGHAIAAHVDLARPGLDGALAAWREASGVSLAVDPDTGATLDAPEGAGILLARVDVIGASTLRVWAVGSEAGAVAAERAIACGVAAGVL